MYKQFRYENRLLKMFFYLSQNSYAPQVKLFVHLYHLRLFLYSESRIFCQSVGIDVSKLKCLDVSVGFHSFVAMTPVLYLPWTNNAAMGEI